MPNLLPSVEMKPHRPVSRFNSAVLKEVVVNGVSVAAYVVAGTPGETGTAWRVVPQGSQTRSELIRASSDQAALQAGPEVPITLITTEAGTDGVRVLEI